MNYNVLLVIIKLIPSSSETTYWNNKIDTIQFNRFSSVAESSQHSNTYPISYRYFFTPSCHSTWFFFWRALKSGHNNIMLYSSNCFSPQKSQTLRFWVLDNQTRMKIAMEWFVQFSNIYSSLEVLNHPIIDGSVPFLL